MEQISILVDNAKEKKNEINRKLLEQIKDPIEKIIKTYNGRSGRCGYTIENYEITIDNAGDVTIVIKKLIDKESGKPASKGDYNWMEAGNIQSSIKGFIKEKFKDDINIKLSEYYVSHGSALFG